MPPNAAQVPPGATTRCILKLDRRCVPASETPNPVIERNNVHVMGEGRQPMLFAHGFGCDQSMWRLIAPAFASDYRTVLFDHVGAGKSDLASYSRIKYSSLSAYADDLLEI